MSDTSYLSWPFLEPRHGELAARLESWASSELPGIVDHSDVDASCRALVAALASGGWLQHVAPDPRITGARLDVRSLCLIRETLARHAGLADYAFVMQGLGSGPISLFGADALRLEYLDGVRSGRKIAAFALSEPDAGSDVSALSTTARLDGADYVIDGVKTWISNAGIADFYTLFVRTGEAPGARGLSAFVVDADTPGISIVERIELMAPHPMATLRFESCRVPRSRMLGEPGQGFRIAMATLDVFRSTVGAAALGFARRALDETLAYTTRRQVYGAPLSAMQLTQAAIADMAVAIDASALLVYRSAWTRDCVAERVTREAAMSKLFATEAAQRVVDSAVQLFGGLGVKRGSKLEELYREVRALRIYEGASEVQKQVIARQTLPQAG